MRLPACRRRTSSAERSDEGRRDAGNILLTRYPRKDSRQRPVILIHGFSANGTTFAHPALKPGLAQYLWERGRDVWILDLRTSSGLSTARDVWTFEQVACVDIPCAFEFVRSQREREGLAAPDSKIDVVTQCMGAAMLSMAILEDGVPVQGARTEEQRDAFHVSVGNVVLSQISPMVVFTAANIFRAYAVNYVQQAAGTSTSSSCRAGISAPAVRSCPRQYALPG